MNSNNSNPVSKRLKPQTNSDDELTNETDDISGLVLSGSESEVTMTTIEDVKLYVNIFTDDILPEILDNIPILTVEDLLNFRLVNRCWRDAATSVLLKRNLCEISLTFGEVSPAQEVPAVGQVERYGSLPRSVFTYYNEYEGGSFLSDLNQLLTTSHRFPTTSLRLHRDIWYVLANVCSPYDYVDVDRNQLDLLHFMSLYGKKIKKLTICDAISIKTFEDFVNVHMPHLISLDVWEFAFIGAEQSEIPISPQLSPSALLQLNEIVLPGYKHRRFEEDLILALPNLNCIRGVDVFSLEILLQVGKSHCIQDLYLSPTLHQLSTIQQFSKLLTDTIILIKANVPPLKLTSLALNFAHVLNSQDQWNVVSKAIHLILSASTPALKYLDVYMHPSEFLVLFIPPLPYLKVLKLFDESPDPDFDPTIERNNQSSSFKTKVHFVGDVVGDGVRAGTITANQSVHDYIALSSLHSQASSSRRNIIPADYFPSLSNVKIYNNRKQESPGTLLEFFLVENHIEGVYSGRVSQMACDSLVSVTTLDLDTCTQPSPFGSINMAKLFPNVVNLNICYSYSKNLENWVWTFTKLERFIMSGLCQDQNTADVDSFFTGISPELCADLGNYCTCAEYETFSSTAFGLTRIMPFIGDCKNLKLLQLNFHTKINYMFASKVTAGLAFKAVHHRTKIIFSLNAFEMSGEEIQETKQYLDPVAAYIEIQMQE